MKIGLVCPYNIFKGGGVQECVLAIQSELEKRGHQAYVITPKPRVVPGKIPKHIVLLGNSTDFKSPFHTTTQISAGVNAEILQKTIDKLELDVLHFHEPWVPILSRQILTRSNAKNLATFHAKLPDTLMSKTIEKVVTPYTKSILKYLNGLTAVSSAAAEYIGSLTAEQVKIIPNGVDLEHYRPAQSQTSPTNILYVGRLEKRKGVKHLLSAYRELVKTRPDVELIIAGDGPDRSKLQDYVRFRKLKNVNFVGYVTDEQKVELIQQATVFCSPALYGESFGIVLLEAMACQVPIVAGNNPGYAAVLHEKAEQSLVDPKKSSEFASKLNSLLFDNDLRASWINWAAEYVQQFAYSKIVDQYEDTYKKLVDKS